LHVPSLSPPRRRSRRPLMRARRPFPFSSHQQQQSADFVLVALVWHANTCTRSSAAFLYRAMMNEFARSRKLVLLNVLTTHLEQGDWRAARDQTARTGTIRRRNRRYVPARRRLFPRPCRSRSTPDRRSG